MRRVRPSRHHGPYCAPGRRANETLEMCIKAPQYAEVETKCLRALSKIGGLPYHLTFALVDLLHQCSERTTTGGIFPRFLVSRCSSIEDRILRSDLFAGSWQGLRTPHSTSSCTCIWWFISHNHRRRLYCSGVNAEISGEDGSGVTPFC